MFAFTISCLKTALGSVGAVALYELASGPETSDTARENEGTKKCPQSINATEGSSTGNNVKTPALTNLNVTPNFSFIVQTFTSCIMF